MYTVTRYMGGELITYTVDNYDHVAVLLATGRIVSWHRNA